MKIMKNTIKFFFLLLLLYISSSTLLSIDNDYKGLSIIIKEKHYAMIYEMYKEREYLYKSAKISSLNIDKMLESLYNNFEDMVNSFMANKNNLPKCIQDALNAFLNEIKTLDKNGKPRATIEWKIYDDRPGRGAYDRSKYNKDYDDLYFQDVNGSKVTVNGWDFNINSNCGGGVYNDIQTDGNKWVENTSNVNIYGAFKDKCQAHGEYTEIVNGKEVKKTYDTMVSTPAVIFHELIHLLLKRYPGKFNDFKNKPELEWLEEVLAEMMTENVFGDELTPEFYREYKYKKEIEQFLEENDLEEIDLNVLCNLICKDKSQCENPIEKFEWLKNKVSTGGDRGFMDTPDDNYSYFTGKYQAFNLAPDCVILERGTWKEAVRLFGGLTFDGYSSPGKLLSVSRVLVIPSGALAEVENNSSFKYLLESYVSQGGSVIAFSPQYGYQMSKVVPVPETETLCCIGFRQDQSCVRNSGYFKAMHPALSSSTKELLDIGLDGYFPVYPSNSTVLLRRRTNQEPAVLYYPYKNGWVILGANFTDYSASKSMASTSELRIVRDLLSFSKNPGLPILLVDLELEPIPTITRDVDIRNPTAETAVKSILKVYPPDKDQVLYETQQNITLNPGENGQVPFTFTLSGVTPDKHGIWHVFYELYNPDNDLIYAEENDAGRFALYKITEKYTSNRAIEAWITVKDELVYFTEPAAFEFHFRNNTDETRSLDLKYSWNHDLFKTDLPTVTIPAGQQVDLQFAVNAPPVAQYVGYYRGGKAEMLFRLWYGSAQTGKFSQATKGIRFMTSKTKSSIVQIEPDEVPVGKPFTYTIKVINESKIEIVDTSTAVTLEKLEWPGNNYVQVEKIYETLHTFTPGETFSHNGNYTPATPHESGMYRLKLEIQKPEGTREEHYSNFLYINSSIGVSVEPLAITDLTAGTTYPVKILLAKKSFFEVLKGRYAILIKTPDGQIASRKDVENLVLTGYRSIPIEDSITFNPSISAPYYRLEVEYSDETILTPRNTDSGKRYRFKYSAALALDKTVYLYRETANVSLNLTGNGTFDVHFTCAAAGIDEQRVVTVPTGSTGTVEVFQVPIGLENNYNARFAVTSREGLYSTFGGILRTTIPKMPLQLEANGTFGEITARVGTPIDFNLTIKGISGITTPLPGQLKLSCMNYTDVQNVTLLPTGENNFSYHIPVEESLNAGTYHANVSFEHEGRILISRSFPIDLPGPGLELSEPTVQLAAGDTFTLSLENPGGKNGEYQWEVYLKDRKGNSILEYNDTGANTIPINPGQAKEITLEIPGDAASGSYTLLQKAKETNTGKEVVHYSGHQVTGISVTLNTYTLKEKYFDNETVTGKSEVTPGTGAIENGILKAEIVRYLAQEGVSIVEPGEFALYNRVKGGMGRNGKLVLFTETRLFEYDPVNKSTGLLLEVSGSGVSCADLCFDAEGLPWLATNQGLHRRDPNRTWTHWTTADGLVSNYISDIIEYKYPGGKHSIRIATYEGISEYKYNENTWVTYTTAQGLPSNTVFKFALDGAGDLWISTYNGLVK